LISEVLLLCYDAEIRNAFKILAENPEGRYVLEDLTDFMRFGELSFIGSVLVLVFRPS
jgi:hypothetical protein